MTVTSAPGSPRAVTPMGILASRLDQLAHQLDAVSGVDPSLKADLSEACELASGLDPYLSRWTTPESGALELLAQRTRAEDWNRHSGDACHLEQEMLSGHVEGQLLKMLVHASRAKRVLEIGMFTGYSALAMAEALPEDGRVVACEIDSAVAAFAQACFGKSASGHKIVVKVGPAQRTLDELSATGAAFDLVFIDADKTGYADYLATVLGTGLLAPHGVVCVDNTLMQGQPWCSTASTANGDAVAEFNRIVAEDARVEQVIIPLRDGLTIIRRADTGAAP